MHIKPPTPANPRDSLPGSAPRLLEVLASLNQIGATINQIGPRDSHQIETRLKRIVESATQVVPGSSAVIFTYNEEHQSFEPASRVSSGESISPVSSDEPRPGGLGRLAVQRNRRVISYEEPDIDIHPVKIAAGAKTVACFPLIVAEQVLGALYVYLHDERPFSQIELLMLENFVNQAGMAIFQTRQLVVIQRDLARKEDELNRLRRAGLLISSRLRLEETLESILQMAMEVTNAKYGIFRLMDKSGANLITRAVAGEYLPHPMVETLPVDTHSIMGWVAIHRQPVCVPDLQEEPWVHIYYRLDASLEMRSELAVPLIGASGRLEGVLNLESPEVAAFSEQDSHLLQSLATQAVIAIQEARLLDALQVVTQLLLVQPCQQVLNRLAELACDLLNASASAIWILEEGELVLQAAIPDQPQDKRLALNGSLAGQAVLTRSIISSADLSASSHDQKPGLGCAGEWTRALIVPLLTDQDREALGAFCVYSTDSDQGRFAESEWDKKVLTFLAQYAVLAVQNAARQEALRLAQERHAVAETFAAVGDIAANLLHNLNNKVGTIPVRIQGIRDKSQLALATDNYLTANLAEIERSAADAMETVRDNLSYLNPMTLVPIQVVTSVRRAVNAANLPASIEVFMENLESLPAVTGGERNLALVFTNLLENASSAMNGKGIITIRGSSRAGWVEIAVSDNGSGIPPELHDQIFEFHYSGRSAGRQGKLGFGLWWVKTVMTRLGGSISVESDGMHGSTFRLRLPIAKET